MPGPSPEEMGISKKDLSPRDRLMTMRKTVDHFTRIKEEAEAKAKTKEEMDNLVEVFKIVALLKELEDDLETIVNAPPDLVSDQHKKDLMDKYEGYITKAEQGDRLGLGGVVEFKYNIEQEKAFVEESLRTRHRIANS